MTHFIQRNNDLTAENKQTKHPASGEDLNSRVWKLTGTSCQELYNSPNNF